MRTPIVRKFAFELKAFITAVENLTLFLDSSSMGNNHSILCTGTKAKEKFDK